MQLRSALLAATMLATPIAASAQPVTGLYIGGGVGVNFTQKENVSGATVGLGALTGTFCRPMGTLTAAPALSASSTSAGALATGSAPKSKETTATTKRLLQR